MNQPIQKYRIAIWELTRGGGLVGWRINNASYMRIKITPMVGSNRMPSCWVIV